MIKYNIMVFADALFDTIAGTLALMGEGDVDTLINNGYHKRTHNYMADFIPGLSMEAFRANYGARGHSTLLNSMGTMVIFDLAAVTRNNISLPSDHPEKRDITIYVNMWPFMNSEDGALYKEISKGLIVNWPGATIKMTYIHPKQVGPVYMAGRLDHLIIYNFNDWFGCHQYDIPKTHIPDVTVTFPTIIQDIHRHKKEKGVENALVTAFSEYLNLEPLPMEAMSFISPMKMDEWERAANNKEQE